MIRVNHALQVLKYYGDKEAHYILGQGYLDMHMSYKFKDPEFYWNVVRGFSYKLTR